MRNEFLKIFEDLLTKNLFQEMIHILQLEEVEVCDILKFVDCKMFYRIFLKLRRIRESIPTARVLKISVLLEADRWDFKITFENLIFFQSFETSFGTITQITWSKTREIIWRFLVHFWTFENFFKIEGQLWRPRTSIFVTYSKSSFIWIKIFFWKKKSNS